jgi:hypothetical protein
MSDDRRITLIGRGETTAARSWDASNGSPKRIIFADSFSILNGALRDASQDVERIIIDGAAAEEQFLDLLATLPSNFAGDVLFVNGERAFLSMSCRGGGRLLYAMTHDDVQFYLETQQLVTNVSMAA